MDQVLGSNLTFADGKVLVAIKFAPAGINLPKVDRPANVFVNQALPLLPNKSTGLVPPSRLNEPTRSIIMKRLSLLLATLVAAVASTFASAAAPKGDACGECCGQSECAGMISTYEKVSTALAADDLAAAQAAAVNLACCLECDDAPELAKQVQTFSQAASLAEARRQFKQISAALIPMAEKAGDCYIMTCPMAGADWIQTTPTVANPYYGSEMLRCGAVKKTVKSGS